MLREIYSYSGDVRGVPQHFIDFMSERAAGNPKYITETLAALVKEKAPPLPDLACIAPSSAPSRRGRTAVPRPDLAPS